MIDIELVLQRHGYALRRQGRTLGANACPRCGEGSAHSNKLCVFRGRDERQRWRCHACGAHGDAADLLALLEGIPLKEALKRVRGGALPAAVAPKAPTQPAHDPDVDLEAAREVLTRLHKGLPMWEPRVAAYLTKRGISREVIVEAAHRGIVRMLPANPVHARDLMLRLAGGADQLTRAGLWAGQNARWPAQAFRPLWFFPGGMTTVECREITAPKPGRPKAIRAGRLTKPFVWLGDPTRVVVVEGAIDMLSMVQMGERRTIMAIPGACSWRLEWFVAAHQRYGSRFVIALDDDEAGNRMAAHLMGALNDRGIEAQRLVPPQGKDWNEALLAAA